MATTFNSNPGPQSNGSPFGYAPGPISLPSPATDLGAQFPNLSGTNSALSGDINAKLGGTLSPGTTNALQDAAATFGVASGMPGSGLSWNSLYGNLAGAAENQEQEGIADYNSTIPTISNTQTVSPALQTEIATQNAIDAAAPDPTASASYAEDLFQNYLQQMEGPAGGTGSASRSAGPAPGMRSATPGGGIASNPITKLAAPDENNWGFGPNPPAMGPGTVNTTPPGGTVDTTPPGMFDPFGQIIDPEDGSGQFGNFDWSSFAGSPAMATE
jgi:hypothetical protein